MEKPSAYLDPRLAAANLEASRSMNAARRARKQEAAAMEEALRLFARFGWTGHHGVEMAQAQKRVQW